MAVEVSQEVLTRIVELAGDLTKNAKHPSPAIQDDDAHNVTFYRIKLFGKTVKALYQAVSTADEPTEWDN